MHEGCPEEHDSERQGDLFPEEFDQPRVFRSLNGAFIGCFNRQAARQARSDADDANTDTEEPAVIQLSPYLTPESAAALLERWPAPKP
jgi:hypothetical protein